MLLRAALRDRTNQQFLLLSESCALPSLRSRLAWILCIWMGCMAVHQCFAGASFPIELCIQCPHYCAVWDVRYSSIGFCQRRPATNHAGIPLYPAVVVYLQLMIEQTSRINACRGWWVAEHEWVPELGGQGAKLAYRHWCALLNKLCCSLPTTTLTAPEVPLIAPPLRSAVLSCTPPPIPPATMLAVQRHPLSAADIAIISLP